MTLETSHTHLAAILVPSRKRFISTNLTRIASIAMDFNSNLDRISWRKENQRLLSKRDKKGFPARNGPKPRYLVRRNLPGMNKLNLTHTVLSCSNVQRDFKSSLKQIRSNRAITFSKKEVQKGTRNPAAGRTKKVQYFVRSKKKARRD